MANLAKENRLREAMRLLDNVAHLPLKHDKELQRAVKRAWIKKTASIALKR